jgi:hypothetical protein
VRRKTRASTTHRWHLFAQRLLWGSAANRYKKRTDLPPDFWPIVFEMEEAGWHWPPLYRAWEQDDAQAAAREARQLVAMAVSDVAGKDAVSRAAKATWLAEKRRKKGDNTMARVERWEREFGRRLTPKSDSDHIAACADQISRSETTVRNALYARLRAVNEHRRQSR